MSLDKYQGDIKIICRQNKVRSLYVFGSVLTDRFNERSDIDLLESKAMKNPYIMENIDRSKSLIYGV